ncbi:MAG: hypothetical protein KDA45_07280 [Planctomycetales bacterium]|nr:hypothetical protein [Planctomycetales bacterium]
MAGSRGIEAGNAFVRVDADLSPLAKKLRQIDQKFKDLGAKISNVGKSLAAVGAGTSAMGAAILAPISAAVSQFTSASDALADIGLDAKRLRTLSPEDQFQAVADGLSAIDDASRRGAVAQAIFGRSGRQLRPMLSSLREIRQEARDLGLVLKKDDTDAAAKLADAFNRIKRTIGGAFLQVGAAVAEPLLQALNVITQITAKANHWMAANRELIKTIAGIGVGLVVAGAAVTALGFTLMGVGATIASIGTIASTAFAAVGAAIAVATSPVTLAVAGIAAIGYVALEATGGLAKLSEMFGQLGTTATTAWGGIVAAISSGDFQSAGEIAFTALEVAWLTVTTKMQSVWSGVADFFKNVWLNSVESIVHIGADIYFGISKYFDQLAVALQGAFDTAFVYITGAIDSIQTSIAKAIVQAQEFFGLFSEAQSAQIQRSLDDDLARRASGRQSGLDGRASGRQSGLEQRDAARRATASDFSSIVSEDFDRRRSNTAVDSSGLSDAQRRLAALQAKLQEQSAAAVAKVAKAQAGDQLAQRAGQSQMAAESALRSTSSGSVGSFVSGVASQIAGGGQSKLEDLGQSQLSMLESIDGRLRTASEEGALT